MAIKTLTIQEAPKPSGSPMGSEAAKVEANTREWAREMSSALRRVYSAVANLPEATTPVVPPAQSGSGSSSTTVIVSSGDAATLTGTTLAPNVINSSLVSAAGGNFGSAAYKNADDFTLGSGIAGQIAKWTAPNVLANSLLSEVGTLISAAAALGSVRSGIGITSQDGLIVINEALAAVGAQQWSPRVRFRGNGWKTSGTAASQAVEFIQELQAVQGTTSPSAELSWSSSIDGSAFARRMYISSAGGLTVTGAVNASGLVTGTNLDGQGLLVTSAVRFLSLGLGLSASPANVRLYTSATIVGSSSQVTSIYVNDVLTAAANAYVFRGLRLNPIFGKSTFTGHTAVYLDIDVTTGSTGAGTIDTTYGLRIGNIITGSTSNFAISTGSGTVAFGGGVVLGAPTGGDKGAGALNVAADIYKNNTAYTNPDYVLEHWATGKIERFAHKAGAENYHGLQPLAEVEAFTRKHLHLPRFGQGARHGLFSGADAVLASVEEAYLYLFAQAREIADLKAEVSQLKIQR